MKDERTADLLELAQCLHHLLDIVSINRAEVTQTHGLEEVTAALADDARLHVCDKSLYGISEPALSKRVPDAALSLIVSSVGGYAKKIFVESADIAVNRYIVIIQDDKQV